MNNRKSERGRKDTKALLLFALVVMLVTAAPGFIYFHFFRELSIVGAAIAGLLIGFVLVATIEMLFSGFVLAKKMLSRLFRRESQDDG